MGRVTLVLGALLGMACSPAAAALPFHVVHETRMTVEIQLNLSGVPGSGTNLSETLDGKAGQPLPLARTFALPGGTLRAFLTVTGTPAEDETRSTIRIFSEVRGFGRPTRVERTLTVGAERLTLLELWSDPGGKARLVAALTARWAEVPRIVARRVGGEPVSLRVEAFAQTGRQRLPLEEGHLMTLVGSPARWELTRRGVEEGAELLIHGSGDAARKERERARQAEAAPAATPADGAGTPGAEPSPPAASAAADADATERRAEGDGASEADAVLPPGFADGASLEVEVWPEVVREDGRLELSVRAALEAIGPAVADPAVASPQPPALPPPRPPRRYETLGRAIVALGEPAEFSVAIGEPHERLVVRVTAYF